MGWWSLPSPRIQLWRILTWSNLNLCLLCLLGITWGLFELMKCSTVLTTLAMSVSEHSVRRMLYFMKRTALLFWFTQFERDRVSSYQTIFKHWIKVKTDWCYKMKKGSVKPEKHLRDDAFHNTWRMLQHKNKQAFINRCFINSIVQIVLYSVSAYKIIF